MNQKGEPEVFGSADNLSVYTLKASDGTLLWRYQLPNALSSVSIAHGVVYVTTLDGTIYALKADNGSLLWKHGLPPHVLCCG